MGLAMATNLQRHLTTKNALNLVYSNRTMSRGEPLKAIGGIPETNFEKLVAQCGIIFTMVSQSVSVTSIQSNSIQFAVPIYHDHETPFDAVPHSM